MSALSADLFDQLLVASHDVRAKHLDGVSVLVHRGYIEGHLTDSDYAQLVEAVQTRRNVFSARTRVHAHRKPAVPDIEVRDARRQRRDRRRVWSGCGALPYSLRIHFTQGENAVAAVIRAEVRKHGFCTLPYDQIAKAAGLKGATVVKRFVREAKKLGLIDVVVRPVKGGPHMPNVITIISADWIAWNQAPAERQHRGHDRIPIQRNPHLNTLSRVAERSQRAGRMSERAAGWPAPS